MPTNAVVNIKIGVAGATDTVDNLNQTINETVGSVGSLKKQLRSLTEELQQLEPGSARFQELSQRAGQLRDQISDTNAVVNQLAGSFTERLAKGISNSLSIGVAGYQALTSAQALFGEENEELQKMMVKLTALMNLSQALETFGGLGDKITELRTTFNSLTTSVQTMRVAQTGANAATTAGTIATTALGMAMKALPIIAIAATIATLVYGLYQLVSANDDATESTKKQREEEEKRREELVKAAAEARKLRVEETKDINTLINRIQSSNKGSAERERLIKSINETYKLTLQNLQDEVKFQQQLAEVYILVNKQADIKARRNVAEEKLTKVLEKQKLAQESLDLAAQRYNSKISTQFGLLKVYENRLNDVNGEVSIQQTEVNKLSDELDAATQELDKFSKSQDKSASSTKNTTNTLLSYEEVLKLISLTTKSAIESEDELIKTRVQNGELSIDLVERERDRRILAVKEQYEATKLAIQKNLKDEKDRIIALNLLNQSYTDFIRFEEQLRTSRSIELERQRNEAILKERENFGDLVFDLMMLGFRQESELDIKSRQRLLDSINYQMSLNTTGYINWRKLMKDRYALFLETLELEKQASASQLAVTYQNEVFQLQKKLEENKSYNFQIEKSEEGKFIAQVKFSKKTQDEINDYILKGDTEKAALLQMRRRNDEKQINDALLKLYEAHLLSLTELDGQYNDARKTNYIETNNEIFQKTLSTIDYWSSYAQDAFTQASSFISEFQQREIDDLRQFLSDSIALDREMIDAQFAQNLISKAQYDNEVEQLEFKRRQKEIQIAKKAFNQKKALDIAAATMDGARAVLSTFANTPGEIIIKSIAAGIAAAFATVQVGIIASQQFRAAKGGLVPGERSDYDKVDSKLAPGEAVINSKSTMDFLPVLSMINQYAGGKSFMPDVPAVNQGQSFSPVFNGNGGGNMTVRAYVVESDITQSQKRINRIEKSITF
jgi:uncharacterized coiled-coil protein SlyX